MCVYFVGGVGGCPRRAFVCFSIGATKQFGVPAGSARAAAGGGCPRWAFVLVTLMV